jgi:hypothetical protein
MSYAGSCLCGAICYHVDGEFISSSHCHCTMCQKQHGAACDSYGNVSLRQLEWRQGQEMLHLYESTPGVFRGFCSKCGSSLTWANTAETPNSIAVSLGTLDTPFKQTVTKHIFTESRVSW